MTTPPEPTEADRRAAEKARKNIEALGYTLNDEALEIIAAAIAGARPKWLDIASAPSWDDKTRVLVTGGLRYGDEVALVKADGLYWKSSGLKAMPTHWMPLPEPPIAAAKAEKGAG